MTTTLTKGPYKADHVGSFLRPERIKEARVLHQNGDITREQLRNIEDEEITRLVEKQKEAGLQAVTDGEFRRAWWHFDFLSQLEGVELYETDAGIQFNGVQTKAHGIKVVGKLDFSDHPMLEDYKFLHDLAGDHVAKFTIPSPNMLFFRGTIDEKVYPDKDEFFNDLITVYQKAIQAFYDAGCRYLQLDDTAWAVSSLKRVRNRLPLKVTQWMNCLNDLHVPLMNPLPKSPKTWSSPCTSAEETLNPAIRQAEAMTMLPNTFLEN